MNLKEAYSILELAPGATPEEVKKKYRELTKKYHPDINKEAGAEAKFKKINEAHEVVKSGKSTDLQDRAPRQGGFHRQHFVQLENIEMSTTISFKESVLGCKKEIKYDRQTKCTNCNGQGEVRLHNGCKKCGGRGQVTSRQGNMIVMTTCDECYGRAKIETCTTCNGNGSMHAHASVHVSIPAGIMDGNTLRLQGMGNFAGSFMGFADQYTDAFLHVTVNPDPGLSIEGQNVVSTVTISLLEALQGCKRKVKTIHGEKEIQIKPQSRNREEVIIPHHGVNNQGNQRVILDVEYPKNTDKLIGVLVDEVV